MFDMDMLPYLNSNDMKEKGIFREPTEKPLNNTEKTSWAEQSHTRAFR